MVFHQMKIVMICDGLDKDCDGITINEDCDDLNALSTSKDTDFDCDGVVTEEDCDDTVSYLVPLIQMRIVQVYLQIQDLVEDGNIPVLSKKINRLNVGEIILSGQCSSPDGLFVPVGTGDKHSCGLQNDGTIECWGDNEYGHFTAPTDTFIEITVGGYNSCALNMNGEIRCWGTFVLGNNNWSIPILKYRCWSKQMWNQRKWLYYLLGLEYKMVSGIYQTIHFPALLAITIFVVYDLTIQLFLLGGQYTRSTQHSYRNFRKDRPGSFITTVV